MISDERYIQMQKKRATRILGRMEDPTEKMINALRL
jgi:hypothetical protein